MIVHRAAAVLPIAGPPLRDAWVTIADGRIAACGSGQSPPADAAPAPFAGAPFAILPALVNAHTHLELSYLRGEVPAGGEFVGWIRTLVSRRRGLTGDPSAVVRAARDGIREAHASGTGLVGDVCNTLVVVPLLAEERLAARVFFELFGLNAEPESLVGGAREQIDAAGSPDPDIRISLAPHAPYTVMPSLFAAIVRDGAGRASHLSSLHLAESRAEVEFLLDGGGPMRALLEELGTWNPRWAAPACGPLEYAARLGLLDPRVLIVHGVQLTDDELGRVRDAGATVVTCPRSNRWTGAGLPPIGRFYASGARIALGTDSLASVEDLNLFMEMAAVRGLAPAVAAARILESATKTGADALGFGAEMGTIEPGKRARLIAVRVPAGVADVEEYLLTGIEPADIRWLESGDPAR